MKKVLFLVLSLMISFTMYAQEIDPKTEAEYTTAYNNLSRGTKQNINYENTSKQGVVVLLTFSVDTLNKEKYLPKPAEKQNKGIVSGKDNGILAPPVSSNDKHYDYLFTMIETRKDSCLSFFYTPNPFVLGKFYNGEEVFCTFNIRTEAGKIVTSGFEEFSWDSTKTRYRNTLSSPNLHRIKVPLKVEKFYYSESPLASKNVFGKVVLTTGAFYTKDEKFKGKYLFKRYRMTAVFQSPVNTVNK